MNPKINRLAPLVGGIELELQKKPSHVIYSKPMSKGWLLEHIYGFWFLSIFDFSKNVSKIHPFILKRLINVPLASSSSYLP